MKSRCTSSEALAALAAIVGCADAFWRMPCPGRLTVERADPIISPGEVSGHVHTFAGSNAFNFQTNYQDLRESTCSSCPIKEDLSLYWSPQLYYHDAAAGTFEQVPQVGAMTVYYLQRGPEKVQAFPPGFRMIAGDPFQRNFTKAEAAPGMAVSFVCLDYYGVNPKVPDGYEMPDKYCADGLRAQVFFPSCWDGVNLDMPDHKSHMAYPIGAYDSGVCPESHPNRTISLFYEVIYQTNLYSDRWTQGQGLLQQPFVFAMGDPTGYGFHGDFINGWNQPYLQRAVDTCTADSGRLEDCSVFTTDRNGVAPGMFPDDVSTQCSVPVQINERINGTASDPLKALPGCNPVSTGSAYAPPVTNCNVAASIGGYEQDFGSVLNLGYAYVGCGADDYFTRTFTGASTYSDDMTPAQCVTFCKGKGYSLAGVEYSTQCYCDNTYHPDAASRAPQAGMLGNCNMPCAGNSSIVCGGGGAMNVYQACTSGSACVDAGFTSPVTVKSATRRHRKHKHAKRHVPHAKVRGSGFF